MPEGTIPMTINFKLMLPNSFILGLNKVDNVKRSCFQTLHLFIQHCQEGSFINAFFIVGNPICIEGHGHWVQNI